MLVRIGAQRADDRVIGYVVTFAYYFANYFVIIFFNSALIACAIIRFKGGDPHLMDGFSAAIVGTSKLRSKTGCASRSLFRQRGDRSGMRPP